MSELTQKEKKEIVKKFIKNKHILRIDIDFNHVSGITEMKITIIKNPKALQTLK